MPPNISPGLSQGLSTGSINLQPTVPTGRWTGSGTGNPTGIIDGATSQTTTQLQFPSDVPKYYMTLFISDYARQDLRSVGSTNRRSAIRLPLPGGIEDIHNEDWREYEHGMTAGIAADWFGINTAGGQMATGTAQFLSSATGNPADSAVGRGLAGLAGWAPNMFHTILYRGLKFKTPKFHWKLAPRTATESNILRDIIATLHQAAAPGISSAGSVFFTFPSIFQISYVPNSHMLCKYKPAVITDMRVNFAGAEHIAFYKGTAAPESVLLELHFTELEYWTKENYERGSQSVSGSTGGENVSLPGGPAPAANTNFLNNIFGGGPAPLEPPISSGG